MSADAQFPQNEGEDGVMDTLQETADEELEQYGVWVKVAPQEIGATDDAEEPDGAETAGSGETFGLTEEEEDLLADLEESAEGQDTAEDLLDHESPGDEVDPDIPDVDFDLDEELADVSVDELPDFDMEELESNEEDVLGESQDSPENPPDSLDLELELEDMELEDDSESNESTEDLSDFDMPDIEDLSFDDNDDSEAAAESESSEESDLLSELSATEDADEESPEDLDEPDPDETDVLPGADDDLEDIDLEELKQSDFGEELAELDLDDDSVEEQSPREEPDDVAALEADLLEQGDQPEEDGDAAAESETPVEALSEAEPPEQTDSTAGGDETAADVLRKIEVELQSIKHELTSLKDELTSLRTVPAQRSAAEPPTQEARTEESEEPGFFAEDEDETIALTGDELDNILNTADIMEETVSEGESPDDDLLHFQETTPESEATETTEAEESAGELGVTDGDDLQPEAELEDASGPAELLAEDIEELEIEDELTPEDLDDAVISSSESLMDQEDLIPLEPEDEEREETGLQEEASEADEEEAADSEEETQSLGVDEDEALELEELDEPEPLSLQDQTDETEEAELEDLSELDLSDDMSAGAEDISLLDDEVMLEPEEDLTLEELSSDSVDEDTAEELGVVELEDQDSQSDAEESPEEPEIELDLSGQEDESDFEPEFDLEEIDSETSDDSGELGMEEIDRESIPEPASVIERDDIPEDLKEELRTVLSYMDHLLESLPEEKIQEFAQSQHFGVYKRLFEELGLET